MRGALNTNSRLSEDDVRCIRAEPRRYGSISMLAKAFGVHRNTIKGVIYGNFWKSFQPQH